LTVFSTVICTLSAVVCCVQIFSLDIIHVVGPTLAPRAALPGRGGPGVGPQSQPGVDEVPGHESLAGSLGGGGGSQLSLLLSPQLVPQRSSSVTLECTSPPDTFLQSVMDFEEFVPPVPPPPYYPPEYTCSSETDAQRYGDRRGAGRGGPLAPRRGSSHPTWLSCSCLCSITYNGSMDSPVPLYPTDFPPSYETVMGLRGDSQVGVGGLRGQGLAGGSRSARAVTAPARRPPCSTRS